MRNITQHRIAKIVELSEKIDAHLHQFGRGQIKAKSAIRHYIQNVTGKRAARLQKKWKPLSDKMTNAIYTLPSGHPARSAAAHSAARAGNATRKAQAISDKTRKITAISGSLAGGTAAAGALAYHKRNDK